MSQQKSILPWFLASSATGAVLLSLALTGCGGGDPAPEGSSKFKPASDSAPTAAINAGQGGAAAKGSLSGAGSNSPAGGATSSTSYSVPQGTTEQLLVFMQQLGQQPPAGATDDEMIADVKKMQRAIVQAADRLLASDVDMDSRMGAIGHKVMALQTLIAVGEDDAIGSLETFANGLSKSPHAEIAQLGPIVLFDIHFGTFATSENTDSAPILQELKALLASPRKSPELFELAKSAIAQFNEMKRRDDTVTAMRATAEAFGGHENQQIAQQADELLQQLYVLDLGLDTKIQKLRDKDPAAADELKALVQRIVQEQADIQTLIQVGPMVANELKQQKLLNDAAQVLRLTGDALRGNENPQVAAFGQDLVVKARMTELDLDGKFQKLRDKDPAAGEELKAIVQQLVQERAENQTLAQIGMTIAGGLKQNDQQNDAMQVLAMTGQALQGSEDPHFATVSEELLVQSRMIQRGYDESVRRLILGEEGAAANVVAAVQDLLRNEKPGETVLASITQIAEYLEHSNEFLAQKQVVDMMEAVYANHAEEEFAKFAKEKVASNRKRLGLVGRPFVVHGLTVDGKPFDWTPYKGKVVLVDFWATWCRPCLAEIPNIRRMVQAYKDQGFEVVSVNLDESKADLEAWLAVNASYVPWPIVISDDPAKAGFQTPLAVECAVESLPFILLVNPDGVVEAMHLRGSELEQALEKKFGPLPVELRSTTPAANSGPAANTGPAGPAAGGATQSGGVAFPASGDGAAADFNAEDVFYTAFFAEDAEEEDESAEDKPLAERNPYSASPGLSDTDLMLYLLDMSDKPRVIRDRPGFADAVIEASERLAAMDTKPNYKRLAILSKLRTLHYLASFGDDQADERLSAYVDSLKDNEDAKVAAEVKFLRLERAAINCDDLPVEKVADLLNEIDAFFAAEKNLDERHLRLASNTVRAINRLEDDDLREKHFAEFGKLFAASSDKQLSAYGKKLSKSPAEAESDLVGKELELTGLTTLGAAFEWKAYRGKVVIVDFWATWCGPCIREMPHVRELHTKLKDKGFDVVGVSLDKDLDALAKFLEENNVPWENLAGEATQDLARTYGVRGIPTMMLIDREGKVVAVSHQVETLAGKAEELVNKAAE